MLSPDNSEEGIFFGKPESNISGGIIYNNGENPNGLQFRTGGNNIRMVVNATGGITVRDPFDNEAFNCVKSGSGYGIYMEKNTAGSSYPSIYGQAIDGAGVSGFSTNSYGIAAFSDKDDGIYAITYSSGNYAGFFNGNIYIRMGLI
jgi:hypothetical protein